MNPLVFLSDTMVRAHERKHKMRKTVLRVAAIVAVLAALIVPVLASTASAGYTLPSFNHSLFERTWKNDDLAVLNGEVARSWRWGPALQVNIKQEPYKEAPGGFRTVQYFEKSRMEDNSWRIDSNDKWAVTNGLLAVEMATGLMQLGDNEYFDCGPANIPIAGDLNQTGVSTYATFYNDAQGANTYPWASEFSTFMEDGNNVYAVGLAKANPTNETFKVGGTPRTVVAQLGERRVLTFTPDNPEGWQIEWGNVGTHYYEWRYGPGGCMDKMNGEGNPPPDDGGNNPPPSNGPEACQFSAPGDLGSMDSKVIEDFKPNTWTHRVFNPGQFKAPNWDGADSWFVTTAQGPHGGGGWTDFNNPGQIIYRGVDTHIRWCLGVLTTSTYNGQDLLSQFLGDQAGKVPAAINIRIAPNSVVTVVTASGNVVHQATSDMGDITVILPDNGVVVIAVDYTTAAPTHESHVWWGPYDRSASINTVDAR